MAKEVYIYTEMGEYCFFDSPCGSAVKVTVTEEEYVRWVKSKEDWIKSQEEMRDKYESANDTE